ncbi:MAG TPA: adenylate/guanylate cyclase domain-containing protein [Burkholderiales bacterium]|nr:adenylate/guanylate cyclase domain-containing protein [Burkholderiales bacterium]
MSTGPTIKRKLAAILAADAVGYSRLMGTNEEKTLKVLAVHRAVIDGIIAFHEGRIVNTAGDSVLAEFASPVEAVRCAVEMQDSLKTRNDSLPEDQRMQFRVGVNLGDVMVKGDDLLGDGVNIAARLESIAEPGGICVSSAVYDQIAGKLDLGFVDIGTQSLKNIPRPIQAYRIQRGGARPAPSQPAPPPRRRAPWLWGGIAAAAVIVLAGGAWMAVSALRSPERAKYEAELARARAEAEAAVRRAEADAAAAATAKRALEAQQAAEKRARAEAELARAQAAAQRRKAAEEAAAQRAAEAATARKAARSVEPAPKLAAVPANLAEPPSVPRSYEGRWAGQIACQKFGNRQAFSAEVPVEVTKGRLFSVQHGEQGNAGSFRVSGAPDAGGRLQMSGEGFTAGPTSRRGRSASSHRRCRAARPTCSRASSPRA